MTGLDTPWLLEYLSGVEPVIALGTVLDLAARRRVKQTYGNWIFTKQRDVARNFTDWVVKSYDVFFRNEKGKTRLSRSIIVSGGAFCLFGLTLVVGASVDIRRLFEQSTLNNYIGLSIVFFVNLFVDYASLIETRFLMGLAQKRGPVTQVAILLLDIIATFLIWSFSISILFWALANMAKEPGWAGPLAILWHMCHQANSPFVVFSNLPQETAATCDFILPPSQGRSGYLPNFEHLFNTISLTTTYLTSLWLMVFLTSQVFIRFLEVVFTAPIKTITKVLSTRFPFTISAVFFSFYMLVFALCASMR